MDEELRRALDQSGQWFHPCYYEEAHKEYARMHLPVARRCNIQCRFCNRLYDCVNETRPGVTSRMLSPQDAADLVDRVAESIPALSVVGIAGPGDALANSETFETFQLVRKNHPELTLCLATNGLLLPFHVKNLLPLGVKYVTVTINALNPEVGSQIYSWIRHEGQKLNGETAFQVLSTNQWKGVQSCVDSGVIVKINSVMIPGINELELPMIAEKSRDMGVDVMNVIPFQPVRGSEFEMREEPTEQEIHRMREVCGGFVRQISHCARCRADAIGYLDCDVSREFFNCL